ncbi:unnamed protein product [Bursaphelenchus xylophilus]|uniref:(pine wood nematode) hypothetical protein n=1 Tax=Bursaphelenchus xylophilus TaxID=6326 RepID=A0A1I7S2R7_BURXY|nr:unnamed protein product [Bursaphelenchus xylophilus]CAG9121689.1 unnamed protein product [Bursaphelenchus xylophilus]
MLTKLLLLLSIVGFTNVGGELSGKPRHTCYETCLNYSRAIGKPTHDWCAEYAEDDLCKTAECWTMCRDLVVPPRSVDFYAYGADNSTSFLNSEEEEEDDDLYITRADETNSKMELFELNSRTLYVVLAFLAVQLNVLVLLIACGVRRCAPEDIAVEII